MKHRVLFLLLFVVVFLQGGYSQLDTLFYDDFDDNRHGWKLYADETGYLRVADGYLEYSRTHKRRGERFFYVPAPIGRVDTFHYDLRLVPVTPFSGGAFFNTYRMKRKNRLGMYTVFYVSPKWTYGYMYSYYMSETNFHWSSKVRVDCSAPLHFRVAYGSGRYYYSVNGQVVGTERAWKHDVWNDWGWIAMGNNHFKIDWMAVCAPRVDGSGAP